MNERTTLGIIPARKGSKGLPGKNVRPLCGKPLVQWTIEQALSATALDAVLVSTDCLETIEIARALGAEAPFVRPAELADDTAPTIAVIDHAVEFLASQGRTFDNIILLEPTSPLREPGDIDGIVQTLNRLSDTSDAVISVGMSPHHPSILKRLVGDRIERFCPDVPATTRRQDDEPAFFPFGVGYACKTDVLLRERTFYVPRSTWYRIKRHQEYEIDDIYDFLCVEAIMNDKEPS